MKPKVVLVTGSGPPDACGVGDYTVALASALEKAGERVELFCHRDWSVGGTVDALQKLWRDRDALVHMQYPTVGYGHSLGPQVSLLMRGGVVTMHEFSLAHPFRKVSLFPFTLCSPLVVMPSEFERRALVRKMPWMSKRVRVIPIASNIHFDRSPSRSRDVSVIYFGLIAPRKGIEDFLEFARLVRAKNFNWELAVIGKVSLKHEAYAKSLASSLAQYRVRAILDRNSEEVAELLSRAGLAYLPFPDGASDRRGSLKAVLAAGLPCLTTCSEQTPDELARAVVQTDSPYDAAEAAVHFLAAGELRKASSEKAYEYSRQFSWERIAELHVDMYRELRTSAPRA